MLTALEFINVEQLHKKNFALLPFHLSSAIPDHILNRIGIIRAAYLWKYHGCYRYKNIYSE